MCSDPPIHHVDHILNTRGMSHLKMKSSDISIFLWPISSFAQGTQRCTVVIHRLFSIAFFCINTFWAIAEALCADKEMNFIHFSGIFSVFNFVLEDGYVSNKNKNTNILDDGKPSVLWHSMETTVNFVRHLTSINVLYLAYLKHEQCSQQYSVRHIFIPINRYRQQALC
jgi:hypothetical protein